MNQTLSARQGLVSSNEESYPCVLAGCSTGPGIFNEESYPSNMAVRSTGPGIFYEESYLSVLAEMQTQLQHCMNQMHSARQGLVSSNEESYPCVLAGCSTGPGIFQ